jgi:WD40 repeat protein
LEENLSTAFAFDGHMLVAGDVKGLGNSRGGMVKAWDIRNLKNPLLELRLNDDSGDVLAVELDRQSIVSSYESGEIQFWSIQDGSRINVSHSTGPVPGLIYKIAVDRDVGRFFFGSSDGGIYFIDLGKEARHMVTIENPSPLADFREVTALRVNRRGLVSAFRDSSICFYDFASPLKA